MNCKLTNIHEEENKESERTVTPEKEKKSGGEFEMPSECIPNITTGDNARKALSSVETSKIIQIYIFCFYDYMQ